MASQRLITLLERTTYDAIYYNGWHGLAASAVLRAMVEHPPPSLVKNFDKIIHVDCSRWKSRRALQRKIAEELKLPESVIAMFDKQDEDDDFEGLHEGSRDEIHHVVAAIYQSLQEYRCLVVFQSGSQNTIDLNDFGIPRAAFGTRILWTFRGRFLLNSRIESGVETVGHFVYERASHSREVFLQAEAREIARSIGNSAVNTEIAAECCMYMLSLISQGGKILDYKWATHAAKYWVCDGIIHGGQDDEAWDVGTSLHQWIRLEDYSFDTLPPFADISGTPQKLWIVVTSTSMEETRKIKAVTVPPESTSFFLAVHKGSKSNPPLTSLPDDMFHPSDKLRVLRLCNCSFNFSAPPFHGCRSLRFLGLDSCRDQQKEETSKQGKPTMECFHSLWVLDINDTTWELALSPETIDQMAANIREVHMKKGRIWCSNFSWGKLQNLRKFRTIEPTHSWETDEMDEFTHMVRLELLDLSGISTIQVLPRLSEAVGLKTLILDGCVELEHVGPDGLPPSIESFCLTASSSQKTKVSKISLVGCVHLENFILRGALPCLEELDLSGTLIRKLDFSHEVVQVPKLERLFLIGCENLHAILWQGVTSGSLKMLHISNQGKDTIRTYGSSFISSVSRKYDGKVYVRDARFIQSLVLGSSWEYSSMFLITESLYLNLDNSLEVKAEGRIVNNVGIETSNRQIVWPVQSPMNSCYCDFVLEEVVEAYEVPQLLPLYRHIEIGDGINLADVDSEWGVRFTNQLITSVHSWHVHDNSSILAITSKPDPPEFSGGYSLFHLRWCHVEKCPKLQAVFTPYNDEWCHSFPHLETIWVTDLQTAGCIWSKGMIRALKEESVFGELRSIHLHNCPRLKFVLPISSFILPSLETIQIVHCGNLRQIFPWDVDYEAEREDTVKDFPKLKHIYLHQIDCLEQICEAKMFAPKLETIRIRGSWGLRRLPAIGLRHGVGLPVVDCEKDLWDSLDWDGIDAGHHPSLYETHHSLYYKKALPRVSVLR